MFTISGLICNLHSSFFFGVIVSEIFLIGLFIGDLKGESGNSFMGEASESFLVGLFIGDLKGESCNSFMGEIKDDRVLVLVVSFIVSMFFFLGVVVNLVLSLVGDLKVSSSTSFGVILTGDLRVISASLVSSKSFLIDLLMSPEGL